MPMVGFWLSQEEYEQLKRLQKLRDEKESIHAFCKQIVLEYLQGRIRNLAIEKAMKEVALELETQRKVLLELQTKLEEKESDKDIIKEVRGLFEEILEKVEKLQVQDQVQGQGQNQPSRTSDETFDILIALKELGTKLLLINEKRKNFEDIMDGLLSKYK